MNKKIVFTGIILGFFIMGFISMQRAMPEEKVKRVYDAIHLYSPYKLEKSMSGFNIIDVRDGRKETPSAADVFLRYDALEKEWASEHIVVNHSRVYIKGDNNQTVSQLELLNAKERTFVKKFYGK